jgi:hypothetical protein
VKLDVRSDNNATTANFRNQTSITNSPQTVIQLIAGTTGTAAAGLGAKLQFRQGDDGYAGYTAGSIHSSRVDNSNHHLYITPEGTGDLVLDGLKWPQTDGSANQVLKTDGSAQLSWVANTAGPTGPTGPSGPSGPTGPTGPSGPSGVAGDIDDLTDAKSGGTDFTGSLLLGHQNHGTLSSATYNTGVGHAALDALTSGVNNVAVGWSAASALTDATDSVIIGKQAGVDITSNSRSVAIGSSSGKNQGFGCTSVGFWSGIWALGTNNVNIGYGAGARGTANATKNVFVGDMIGYSGDGTFEGDYNIGIGAEAMYSINGNANYNIGIGRNALRTLDDGANNNTAIGYDSGVAVTDAEYNILVGYESGSNITSGSNNLVIGSGDVDSATGDNQLLITTGDGNIIWIKGDADGLVANKISVVAITGTTTLTDAQSGSYVYVTGSGAPTLPATAEIGQQYTIINNTGSDLTPGLGTSNSTIPSSHTAISDDKARTYVAVAANTWFFVG